MATKQGQRLATGHGHAPGAYPNSFRSEAYGVLAALRLITRILPAGGQNCHAPLRHWLDNQSVINRINNTMDRKYTTPNQKLQSEQDVIDEIVTTMRSLPLSIEVKWVKGHQDQGNNFTSLSLPAQLNCEADRKAATPVLRTLTHPQIVPWLPQTPCQFRIHNRTITSKIKRHIHHAAQTPNSTNTL